MAEFYVNYTSVKLFKKIKVLYNDCLPKSTVYKWEGGSNFTVEKLKLYPSQVVKVSINNAVM